MSMLAESLIEVRGLQNYFDDTCVHKDLNLSIASKEVVAIIGSSGCGKTTLLRSILMLHESSGGRINVFGHDLQSLDDTRRKQVQHNWGVMFQSCALFTSLTIAENIVFPLEQATFIDATLKRKIALLKLSLVGLEPMVADLYPSEISGGMRKRVAMARAIVMDPKLVFLDEPTAGLDPVSANELDMLVKRLRDTLGVTFVIVTHDLDTLWAVTDRVVFLGEGRVLADAPMAELVKNPHPLIQDYFSGDRANRRQ